MTCKLVGLTLDDMEIMTIGDCLDYATDYIKIKNQDSVDQPQVKKATQADFDNF